MRTEFAPRFEERFAAQIAFEKSLQESDASGIFNITAGLYLDTVFPADKYILTEYFEDNDGVEHELYGPEVFFRRQIQQQLDSQEENQPVNVLDIGGGVGLSWRKLSLYYEDLVREGRMSFIVSNLHQIDTNLAKVDGDLVRKTNGLVHYVSGTFDTLGDQTITTSAGVIPIRGNIDIAHENLSLTSWGKIPEVDIPEVANYIRPNGLYIVPEADTRQLNSKYSSSLARATHFPQEIADRLEGIAIAHQRLEDIGLRRETCIETGSKKGERTSYIMFKGRNAPPIAA